MTAKSSALGAVFIGAAAGAAAVALSDKKNRNKVLDVVEQGKEKANQLVKGGKSTKSRAKSTGILAKAIK